MDMPSDGSKLLLEHKSETNRSNYSINLHYNTYLMFPAPYG